MIFAHELSSKEAITKCGTEERFKTAVAEGRIVKAINEHGKELYYFPSVRLF